MKHHILSSLTAIFLALAIAFCGIAIPRLLIQRQTDQLTTASELLSYDQLTPYSVGVDSPVRIQKLSSLVTTIVTYGTNDMYSSLREPLDTELSAEAAIDLAASFLADLLETVESMGLPLPANPSFFDPNYDDPAKYSAALQEYDEYAYEEWYAWQNDGLELKEFLKNYYYSFDFISSPEDSSLALWCLGFDCPFLGCVIYIDAATGIPICLSISGSDISYGDEYLFPAIHAYQTLFPGRYPDFGAKVDQTFPSTYEDTNEAYDKTSASAVIAADSYSGTSTFFDTYGSAVCYTTTSGEISLTMTVYSGDGYSRGPFFLLSA